MKKNKQYWMFEPLEGNLTAARIWIWWEQRRLIYNLIVIITAVISFVAFYYFCATSGELSPGEDVEEPMGIIFGIIFGPIIWNIAYCLGPITDIRMRSPLIETHRGPMILRLGIAFSITLLCVPSAVWFIIWIRNALHGMLL